MPAISQPLHRLDGAIDLNFDFVAFRGPETEMRIVFGQIGTEVHFPIVMLHGGFPDVPDRPRAAKGLAGANTFMAARFPAVSILSIGGEGEACSRFKPGTYGDW